MFSFMPFISLLWGTVPPWMSWLTVNWHLRMGGRKGEEPSTTKLSKLSLKKFYASLLTLSQKPLVRPGSLQREQSHQRWAGAYPLCMWHDALETFPRSNEKNMNTHDLVNWKKNRKGSRKIILSIADKSIGFPYPCFTVGKSEEHTGSWLCFWVHHLSVCSHFHVQSCPCSFSNLMVGCLQGSAALHSSKSAPKAHNKKTQVLALCQSHLDLR